MCGTVELVETSKKAREKSNENRGSASATIKKNCCRGFLGAPIQAKRTQCSPYLLVPIEGPTAMLISHRFSSAINRSSVGVLKMPAGTTEQRDQAFFYRRQTTLPIPRLSSPTFCPAHLAPTRGSRSSTVRVICGGKNRENKMVYIQTSSTSIFVSQAGGRRGEGHDEVEQNIKEGRRYPYNHTHTVRSLS